MCACACACCLLTANRKYQLSDWRTWTLQQATQSHCTLYYSVRHCTQCSLNHDQILWLIAPAPFYYSPLLKLKTSWAWSIPASTYCLTLEQWWQYYTWATTSCPEGISSKKYWAQSLAIVTCTSCVYTCVLSTTFTVHVHTSYTGWCSKPRLLNVLWVFKGHTILQSFVSVTKDINNDISRVSIKVIDFLLCIISQRLIITACCKI